jgi:hypothetical protein
MSILQHGPSAQPALPQQACPVTGGHQPSAVQIAVPWKRQTPLQQVSPKSQQVSPQTGVPSVQVSGSHTPLTQNSFDRQAIKQSPQWLRFVFVSTQKSSHAFMPSSSRQHPSLVQTSTPGEWQQPLGSVAQGGSLGQQRSRPIQ